MKKYPKFRTFHRTFLVRFFFKSWHFVRDIDFVKNVPNFEKGWPTLPHLDL